MVGPESSELEKKHFPQSPAEVPKDLSFLESIPDVKKQIESLPTVEYVVGRRLHLYQGFWQLTVALVGILSCQKHFEARETDVLLVSCPKTGTTWLKALAFAVLKRVQFPDMKKHHPLLTSCPHELVRGIEFEYIKSTSPDFETFGEPRLLASHIPFVSLPTSVVKSGCKIVYVSRDPKDAFLSWWMFVNKIRPKDTSEVSLDAAFDFFTKGIVGSGSYWDHVLGYWKQSLENPKRVLFLRYEEIKNDPHQVVRKLSEFLDCPFSSKEEDDGLVDDIVNLCSFDNLSNLDVNVNGKFAAGVPNNTFFRRGVVGDSVNYLSPEQAKLVDQITVEKFKGSDLMY